MVERKGTGADAPRLALTVFFRVFGVFRGSDSSRDWVAGEARARLPFVQKFCIFECLHRFCGGPRRLDRTLRTHHIELGQLDQLCQLDQIQL